MRVLLILITLICSSCLQAAWIADGQVTPVGQYAMQALQNADKEGLDPQDYAEGVQALSNLSDPEQANAIFTKAFYRYVKDVQIGRFAPGEAGKKLAIKPDNIDPAAVVEEGFAQGGTAWIDELPPQYKQYKLLKQALNNYPKKRKQIIAAMERWRWLPHTPDRRYVLVNPARNILLAYENGEEVLRSKIITGKAYSQTPVFSGTIFQIIFNPSWHVPASIVPELKNPEGRGFYQTKNGGWVQPPGPNNALGQIKFDVHEEGTNSNRHIVYLHSTGKKSKPLFNKDDSARNLSHGCIRVENVEGLAKFAFNSAEWSDGRIKNSMKGTRTNHVKIPNLPIHIVYITVWANENGNVDFAKDLYNQDSKVERALGLGA